VRVLIADPQKDVGRSLAGLVERCGHEVLIVVTSGLEAIQAYARLEPDLVLMDHAMPRLNGATAARIILAKDHAAKIVIISATPRAPSLADTGAIAILPKPVEMHKLYAALYDAGSPRTD
jgi:CheY-like chemotaxis protein